VTAIDFVYLVHPHPAAVGRRTGAIGLWPGLFLEGLSRLLPPLRLGFLEPAPGGSRGLALSVPLAPGQLADVNSGAARRKVLVAVAAAVKEGARSVALGGSLAKPEWAAFIAGQSDLRVITGEAMEAWATLDGLWAALPSGATGGRLSLVVGPGQRLLGETLSILAARRVDGLVLLGPRTDILTGIASRVLADSGLVAEVGGPAGLWREGEPVIAAIVLGPGSGDLNSILGHRAIAVDLTPGRGAAKPLKAARPDLRVAIGGAVGLAWTGPPPRLALPVVDGPPDSLPRIKAAGPVRVVPAVMAEAWLETGGARPSGPAGRARPGFRVVRPSSRLPGIATPTLRHIEALAALAAGQPLCFGRLRWLEAELSAGRRAERPKVGGDGRKARTGSEF
jgi:hypothetical protein